MKIPRHGDLHQPPIHPANVAFWRFARAVFAAAAGALTIATVAQALRGAWDSGDFPEMLLVKVEALPTIFPLHMATGGLALLLVPAAIALSGTRWHRYVARLAAGDVVVAATTAVPVALESPLTPWTAAGFTLQAALWLALLALGLRAVRRGDIRRHRILMLLMAAVTSGAMFFRIFLALWTALDGYAHYKTFYSCDAFAAWLTPLLGMSLWLALRRRRSAARRYGLGRIASRSPNACPAPLISSRNSSAASIRPDASTTMARR